MKKLLTFIFLAVFAAAGLQAQTLEELKAKKADLEAQQKAKQAEADAFNSEIGDLKSQIEVLSGWQTGVSGLLGLNFNTTNNWQASANRNSSSSNLNIGVNAFANNIKEKYFWRNNLNANLSWQGLDTDTKDSLPGGDFLEDRNGDILIGSSLFGYRLNQDFAISLLADLNTSVFNFLEPGTIDVGAGVTWTPHQVPNLVVVVHPLTYHFAFSGIDGIESQSDFGAKVKATYTHTFTRGITWSSNLGAFVPYSNKKYDITYLNEKGATINDKANLFEWTWINSINVPNLWKGIGVGFTLGLRGADFEYPPGLQSYTALGFTYGF